MSDPDYREGFGKDVTGGAGQPTCLVTSSAESGDGSLSSCFTDRLLQNKTIVFAVSTVTLAPNAGLTIGSNVTIDGLANGMNGVTMDATGWGARNWNISDPASNIFIRGINFRGCGSPSNSNCQRSDLLTIDGTNGSSISNVLVDRCTFVQAGDGATDITGNVSNVTIQRSLYHGNAITMLLKYGSRKNISIHHNVFTRNGERNPQIKGDMQLIDFVNNIEYLNDVPAYPDGSATYPYGVRIWSANASSDSPGNVTGNFVGNTFIDPSTGFDLRVDSDASLAGVYMGGNYCLPDTDCPASPGATPNAVPAAYAVTTFPPDQLKSQLLPYVGAPNRTALDQDRLDELAAQLPGSAEELPLSSDPSPPGMPCASCGALPSI